MNVLKAIKVAELRKKLSVIPAKLIIAAILTIIIYWKDWERSIDKLWSCIRTDPKKYLIMLVIAYGVVSYVYFFIRLMHNWIFGLILAVGVAFLVITQAGKLGPQARLIALVIMIFGGPILDLLNLLRYRRLKDEVIRAEEERLEESYGEGYDEGYRKGIREGRRNERRLRREYEEELYESRRSGLGDRGHGSRYDDRYEDGYDDERYIDERYEEEEYEDGRYIDDGYDDDLYDDDDSPRYSNGRDRDRYIDGRDYGSHYGDDYEEGYDGRYIDDRYDDDEAPRYDNGSGRDSYGRTYSRGNSEDAAGFFADCRGAAEIKRRYHDLCKVYHPDSGNGSAELFYRIKDEYDRLMITQKQ